MNYWKITQAMMFAVEKHEGQYRKGSECPYIHHPIEVGTIIEEAGGTWQEISAGILHDVIEDCDVTKSQIKKRFGSKIARYVDGVTEQDKSLPWQERKDAYIKRLLNAEPSVILVSAADKLHNLRSIEKDWEEIGEEIWDVFSVKKEKSLWFYETLLSVFKNSESVPSEWIEEMEEIIDDIK